MTAQISDSIKFHDRQFVIAAVSDQGLFQPQSYGIESVVISTACWRGFHCSYEIINDQLYLMNVHLATQAMDSLGVRYGKVHGPQLFGQLPEISKQEGCWFYHDLNQLISYTGGLLIADNFIRELYVHMGFNPAYKYQTVYELIFETGHLINYEDRSARMADFRERNAAKPLKPDSSASREEVHQWIEQCFDYHYDREND
jgi:hypothetical protein